MTHGEDDLYSHSDIQFNEEEEDGDLFWPNYLTQFRKFSFTETQRILVHINDMGVLEVYKLFLTDEIT